MFRRYTLLAFKRLYHDSKPPTGGDYTVKPASQRRGREIKARLNNEAQPRVTSSPPGKTWEPFPYTVTDENKCKLLAMKVEPLLDMPYDEQMTLKQNSCKSALRRVAHELYLAGNPIRLDATKLPCRVNPTVRSNEIKHYRNLDSFNIWYGHDGKTLTIGYFLFQIGTHGDTVCVEPNSLVVMKDCAIKLVDILQDFIRNRAKLPVCFDLQNGGWRNFTIRTNSNDEIMLIGIASPRLLKVQEIIDERDNFRDFVVEQSNKIGINLKSVYFQPCPHSFCRDKDVPYELIYGDPSIIETVNGHRIQVSPESHMPQSTHGAEILCNTIVKAVTSLLPQNGKADKLPLIIDARCGLGLNLIHLAKFASRIIGIDRSHLAIEDARTNARSNGIENSELIQGSMEIILERVLEKYAHLRQEVVVVCRSPGSGVRNSIISSIRQCERVTKLIYITSRLKSEGNLKNIMTLCEKQRSHRATVPFEIVDATPVDVLPLIDESHVVLSFERSK